MKKYIAVSPVRFDRDYAIGEDIPEGAVDPKMEGRLVAQGKIQPVGDGAAGTAEAGAGAAGGGQRNADAWHICDACGKACANKAALASHKKSHDRPQASGGQ